MSDSSFDSDSENDEVEAVAPRVTYDSLIRSSNHSKKHLSQEHLSERRLPENINNNRGPSKNPSVLSNFPPEFDERFKSINFITKHKHGKPEHVTSYTPNSDVQNLSDEEYRQNLHTSPVSTQISRKKQMDTYSQLNSQVPLHPPQNDFMNAYLQSSSRGPRQPSRNEYTDAHMQPTSRGPRQPSRNEYTDAHMQPNSRGSKQLSRNEYTDAHMQPSSSGPRQPSRNEYKNAHMQPSSQVPMHPQKEDYANAYLQSSSRGPRQPPTDDYRNTNFQPSFHNTRSPEYSRPSNYSSSGDARRAVQDVYASQIDFQQRQHERAQFSHSVSYDQVKEWSSSTNITLLIFEMNRHCDGLSKALKQDNIQFDWMKHLIVSLKRIISIGSQKASMHYILKCVCESKFLHVHVDRFLSELQQRTHPDAFGCFQKLVDVIEYVAKNMRAYTSHCKQPLQSLLDVGKGLNILIEEKDLTMRVRRLLQLTDKENIQMKTERIYYKREKAIPVPDDEEPPEKYSEMTIFPVTDELFDSVEPFLRANKTKGAYRDLEHYLDIHSRLMKEDYLSPIRTGLKDFKIAQQNNESVKEHDLRFYYNVQIAKISFDSDEGITHLIHFDCSPFIEIEWEYSKRLMFGSLLVFSKDNFESTIFATVANRDVEKLKRGILEVMFQNNLEEVFTSSENDIFIMAETTAYFESYRHVLEGLQKMVEIPLEQYIISCKREINPPRYLHRDMCYSIASIMNEVYDHYPVPVLNDIEWPNADSTMLNDSQLDALKLALTNEMTLIQGPPGTGKTYVGLKIMRIILENKIMKRVIGNKGPILVVCFTNHALDQFLEGILEFCPTGIVRVGGRSSSNLLEDFNLKKLRQNPLSKKLRSSNIGKNLSMCRKQLKDVSKAINRFWQETLRLETTILKVEDLADEMSKKHNESLTDSRRDTGFSTHVMSTWLKASNADMDKHINTAARYHLRKVIAKGGEILSDSNLSNKKIAAKIDFMSRVKIYHYWIKKYETFIEMEVEKLFADGAPETARQLQVLFDAKENLSNDILTDDVLKPYMSENVYKSIKGCMSLENKAQIEEHTYVLHWLLDQVSRTDQLLDAIDQLVVTKPVTKQLRGRSRLLTDTKAAVNEDRWVIDDSEDSEASTDESDEDDEDREEGKFSNEGRVKLSDIKELESSYKQFKDREIIMLQRAKLLGIDLIDRQEENEEWQTVNTMSYSKVFKLYNSAEAYTEEEASRITDLWSLQLLDRYRLYKYWVQQRRDILANRLIDLTMEYKVILQRKKEALSVKDVAILKRSSVIGMTTTGAARHRAVLQEVGCRIIVVEEAAEVLEAHIVTTLNSQCQHLILIGDHQQLRPSPTVHKLAVDYDLEISLFERLVNNNIPHVTLSEQHRMRPEISTYLQHIYPGLQDHPSVWRYDDIKGVKSNVFFLQHEYAESEVDDTTSKANLHEARFLTGLCKYFIQHEYLGSQITVLAAYSGQVKAIREEMDLEETLYENVRVTPIDNYQGEENDIILISLVRSNEVNDIGFLKIDNRVCVALSRAKMGLYLIGNFQQLAVKSSLWREIVDTAQKNKVYGIGMKMVCVNHNHVSYIVNPEDFEKEVPEGGCNKHCGAHLPCRHRCTRMCHSSDIDHETTKCMQPCLKQCPEGHPCQKDCYQECGNCEVQVLKHMPLCGHDDQVPCYLNVEDVLCSQNCGETMKCGHICKGQCGVCNAQDFHQPCQEKIELEWSCGHKSNVECQTDVTVEPCPTKCNMLLDCGHRCKGTCGGCMSGRVHRACVEKCKQPLPCGHPCEGTCGTSCVPCMMRCPTSCRHGPCGKSNCGDLCEPCTENCAMICQHRQCGALCMDHCAEPSCSKTCNKPTSCRHKCMSLCGEACVCYTCEKDKFSLIDTNTNKKPQWYIAHEKQERAKKFEVGKDTILMKIPKCKHIFTLTQLDRYVEALDPTNTSFIRCPTCSTPVQGISRYEAINKRQAEMRENKKEDMIKNAKLTKSKLRKLTESKLCVLHFCVVDEGEYLSSKPDLIDSNHAHALSMQMRFAYALLTVFNIHKNYNNEIEFKIRKWKYMVSSIQQSMTLQLQTEMTMEIYRLLLCEQITYVNKTLKNMGITLEDGVKSSLKGILKDLSKQQKLTSIDKNRIQSALDSMFQVLYRQAISDEWSVEAKNFKDRIDFAATILDQPQTEDLITIIQQSDHHDMNAHSTRLPEVSSDTDETED